ncbi:lipopolysaccharide biosynthesis protein [Priestia megaterium]|uniref:lipopolysaccharide biosynthesis protein n=1 Tax=Priestia megaterium TaxID=1404 RepID=UPI00203F90B4|nr:hypothetical protein [Priestia megaterium]MCM3306972.1 hypothetical protein [Priestia megaterium]
MITPINLRVVKSSYKKYKTLLVDALINILSFSLLIVAQQIVALPIISRFYDTDQFGKIVIAFGISNIITSMFGFSIGNARFLDQKVYNSIYLKMLKISSVFLVFICFIIYYFFFSRSYIDGFIYSIICVLGSIRYFILSEYRIKDTHNWVFKQNLNYLLGILIGLVLFYFQRNWLMIFLMAEIISVLFSLYYLQKDNFLKKFEDNSSLKLTNTIHLIINNGASYSLMYYDRFVIYPILGAVNVSLYYSAAISSRIGGLIINPFSNFILGKLAGKKEENNTERIINLVILGSIFGTILYFVLSIITTPILVAILYPNFLAKIKDVFVPICLGAAIMGGVNILKPVIMKYMGAKYYNRLFLVYGIMLIILSVFLCIKYSLLGVAIANAISSAVLFIWLLISLRNYSKDKKIIPK